MNVFTVFVTGSIVCSLAYAAHQGRPVSAQPEGAGNRSVEHEGLVLGQRPKGHTMAALGGGGECTIGEPLNWFTNVHVLPECAELIWGGLYMSNVSASVSRTEAIDVDGDGRDDHVLVVGHVTDQSSGASYLTRSYALEYGTTVSGTLPLLDADTPALYRATYSVSESGSELTLHPVMNASVLLDALCAVAKPCDRAVYWAKFLPTDFKDIDNDGDLDLIVTMEIYDGPGSYATHRVWIENTVKANPPLAADINQDGVVNGLDLTAVLAAWTP